MNCKEAVSDPVISGFTSIFAQFFPYYRFSMITAVLENMIVPMYLSYPSSWSSSQIAVSSVMSQLLYTIISNAIHRLLQGENVQSSTRSCLVSCLVKFLNITFPNETPEKSFAMGSEMISDNQAILCSEALINFLNGIIGFNFKEYEHTFAIRQFTENLIHENRSFSRGVNRINGYIKGTQCKPFPLL